MAVQGREWIQAVVRVGDGRGFVIETDQRRLIITAAHCLPELPEPHAWAERTYANLVGPLGAEPTIWAECLFVDPVSDLAVLCSPDDQRLSKQANDYEAFVDAVMALPIGGLTHVRSAHTMAGDGLFVGAFLGSPEAESEARLLSLDGRWFACKVETHGRGLWIEGAAEGIRGGMSGSPIVTPAGMAIGVVCVSGGSVDSVDDHREGGPNPELLAHLPAWIAKVVSEQRTEPELAAEAPQPTVLRLNVVQEPREPKTITLSVVKEPRGPKLVTLNVVQEPREPKVVTMKIEKPRG